MKKLLLLSLFLFAACVRPHPQPPPPPPQPPQTFHLKVFVKDQANGVAAQGGVVYGDCDSDRCPAALRGEHNATALDGGVEFDVLGANFNVCGFAPGYHDPARPTSQVLCLPVAVAFDQTIQVLLEKDQTKWPPSLARSALPDFPADTGAPQTGVWSDGPYDKTLSFPPPSQPTIDYHRGNFQISVDGFTHGYNDKDRSIVITWEQPTFSPDDQDLVLRQYFDVDGYTHFLLSIPQARNFGVLDQRLLDAAKRVKQRVPFLAVAAFGGDGESWDDVRPWLEQLHAQNTLDEIVVCWQCDQRYSPFDLISNTILVGEWAHARGIKVSQHWVNDAAAWWTPDDYTGPGDTCHGAWKVCDRFSYHRFIQDYVDYQWLQSDVNAPIASQQWSEAKVLQSLDREKLVVAEYDTQRRYDDPANVPEAQGDLKGFLFLCAQGFGKGVEGGFMGGARDPDGGVVRVH